MWVVNRGGRRRITSPPPKWSTPMTLKKMGERLGNVDYRTVADNFPVKKVSPKRHQIDINAIPESLRSKFRAADPE